MAAHGARRHTGFDGRLPALATTHAPEDRPHAAGPAAAMPSVVGGSERVANTIRQPREDLEVVLRLVERLRTEHREDTHKLLEKKDGMIA